MNNPELNYEHLYTFFSQENNLQKLRSIVKDINNKCYISNERNYSILYSNFPILNNLKCIGNFNDHNTIINNDYITLWLQPGKFKAETLRIIREPYVLLNKYKINNIHTTRLHIINCLLTAIPYSISNLIYLKELNLSDNFLDDLPLSISELKNLTILILNFNRFTTIPNNIMKLNLLTLSMTSNLITEIPVNVNRLINLKQLYLSCNNIKFIPNLKLKSLHTLDLRTNHITEIPHHLIQLVKLKKLDLSFNELTNIPKFLSEMNLQCLDLEQNKFPPNHPFPLFLSKMHPKAEIMLRSNKFIDRTKVECEILSPTELSIFRRKKFITNYFPIGFECDTPIIESLIATYPFNNKHNCCDKLVDIYNHNEINRTNRFYCQMDNLDENIKNKIYKFTIIFSIICCVIYPHFGIFPIVYELMKYVKKIIIEYSTNILGEYTFCRRKIYKISEDFTNKDKLSYKKGFNSQIKFSIIILSVSRLLLDSLMMIIYFYCNLVDNNFRLIKNMNYHRERYNELVEDSYLVYTVNYYILFLYFITMHMNIISLIFNFLNLNLSYQEKRKGDCITCENYIEKRYKFGIKKLKEVIFSRYKNILLFGIFTIIFVPFRKLIEYM